MQVLPIRSLSESDKQFFGPDWVNLAYLLRDGFPVPDGLVIEGTDEIMLKFSTPSLTGLKKDLASLKTTINQEPIDHNLSRELKPKKYFLWNGNIYRDQIKLWHDLLGFWLYEANFKSFKGQENFNLSSQAVYFSSKKEPLAIAYFDPILGEVVVKTDTKLLPTSLSEIDQLVRKVNQKFLLPQVLSFMVGDQVKLMQLKQFTHSLPVNQGQVIKSVDNRQKVVGIRKSAIKVYYQSIGDVLEEADGIYLVDLVSNTFDEKVLLLASIDENFNGPIIFELPNIQDGDLSGSLRLIKQTSLLKSSAEAFLFAKNKRGISNLSLSIPLVKSLSEYLQLKRDLAVLGVLRKGSLKFWLQAEVPENIINLPDYITAGMDGVILNLDSLHSHLIGYHKHESDYYKNESGVILQFLDPAFNIMHKAKLPILVKFEDALGFSLLEDLIQHGINGIINNNKNQVQSLPEHLNFLEKRVVSRQFLN